MPRSLLFSGLPLRKVALRSPSCPPVFSRLAAIRGGRDKSRPYKPLRPGFLFLCLSVIFKSLSFRLKSSLA